MIKNYPPHHELPYCIDGKWFKWDSTVQSASPVMTHAQKLIVCRRALAIGSDHDDAWSEALKELEP